MEEEGGVSMGAEFAAVRIVKEDGQSMSYSSVGTCKRMMLDMAGKRNCKDWLGAWSRILRQPSEAGVYDIWASKKARDKEIQALMDEIYSTGMERRDEVTLGAWAFCDHSDCDGSFDPDRCRWIAKALKALRDTADDDDWREFLDGLSSVFESGSDNDCEVRIYRGDRMGEDSFGGADCSRYVSMVYKVREGENVDMDVRVFRDQKDARLWPMMSDLDGEPLVMRCRIKECDDGRDELWFVLLYRFKDGQLTIDPQLFGDTGRAEEYCRGAKDGTRCRIVRCKVDEWEKEEI